MTSVRERCVVHLIKGRGQRALITFLGHWLASSRVHARKPRSLACLRRASSARPERSIGQTAAAALCLFLKAFVASTPYASADNHRRVSYLII